MEVNTYFKINNKIITFFSTKGGVGKSFLATELAFTLANECKRMYGKKLVKDLKLEGEPTAPLCRVCLLDFTSSFDSISSSLECIYSSNDKVTLSNMMEHIQECVTNELSSEDIIAVKNKQKRQEDLFDPKNINISIDNLQNLLVFDEESGLYILPAIPLLSYYGTLVKPKFIDVLLYNLQKHFDFIVIDTSSNMNELSVKAMQYSDAIYLVTDETLPSLVQIGKFTKILPFTQIDKSKISVIVNNLLDLSYEWHIEDMSDVIEYPVKCKLAFDKNIEKVMAKNKPYFYVGDYGSSINKEIRKLARTYLPNLPEKKKSLFSKEYKEPKSKKGARK